MILCSLRGMTDTPRKRRPTTKAGTDLTPEVEAGLATEAQRGLDTSKLVKLADFDPAALGEVKVAPIGHHRMTALQAQFNVPIPAGSEAPLCTCGRGQVTNGHLESCPIYKWESRRVVPKRDRLVVEALSRGPEQAPRPNCDCHSNGHDASCPMLIWASSRLGGLTGKRCTCGHGPGNGHDPTCPIYAYESFPAPVSKRDRLKAEAIERGKEPPPEPERLTVTLTPPGSAALTSLQKVTGLKKVDVINRALRVSALIEVWQAKGLTLYVGDDEGENLRKVQIV